MKALLGIVGLFFWTISFLQAQKQTNHWYTGTLRKMIDFKTDPPQVSELEWDPVSEEKVMLQSASSSSMADSSGQLLFYTDGLTVWNRFDEPMPNGILNVASPLPPYLYYSVEYKQNPIIVPAPGQPDRYYVFTIPNPFGVYHFHYSVVDMRLDGGKGDLLQKDVWLADSMSPRLAAVQHANGKDYWLMTIKHRTNAYYAYRISETGIHAPVISYAGRAPDLSVFRKSGWPVSFANNTFHSSMKFSPDGSKMARTFHLGTYRDTSGIAEYIGHKVELFDFDTESGRLSFLMPLEHDTIFLPLDTNWIVEGTGWRCYSLEFSPDGSKLYVPKYWHQAYGHSRKASLYQYVVNACSPEAIQASRYEVMAPQLAFLQYLQLTSHGNIYGNPVGRGRESLFGHAEPYMIARPNLGGEYCGLQKSAMKDEDFRGGNLPNPLPNFVSSYFKTPFRRVSFSASRCVRDSIKMAVPDSFHIAHIQWQFYDTDHTLLHTTHAAHTAYVYERTGVYPVRLTIDYRYGCSFDTSFTLTIYEPEKVLAVSDTSLCIGDTLHFDLSGKAHSFLWQDSSTLSIYKMTEPDTIVLESIRYGCVQKDTCVVQAYPYPTVVLGGDTILCNTTSLLLQAPIVADTYLWSNGAISAHYSGTNSDTLVWLAATIQGCTAIDSLSIHWVDPVLPDFLGADTVLCFPYYWKIELPDSLYTSYLWENGSTSATRFLYDDQPFISVIAENKCGMVEDTLALTYKTVPSISSVSDTFLCENDTLELSFSPAYSYVWQDGNTDADYSIVKSGVYQLTVTNECGVLIKSFTVRKEYCCIPWVPNLITANGDGLNDYLEISCMEEGGWGLELYDRFGARLYSSENYQNNLSGNMLEPGVYYYALSKKGRGTYKGWVQVMK
jgi:hypothetical protein